MATSQPHHDWAWEAIRKIAFGRLIKAATGGAVACLAIYGASVPLILDGVPLAASTSAHTAAAALGAVLGVVAALRT